MQQRYIDLHPRTRKKLEALQSEAYSDGALRVSNRIKAILLNSDGRTSSSIGQELSVSREIVSKWLKTYDCRGVEGLFDKKKEGRPANLTDLQKILLCDIIESGPVAYGLSTGIWTSPIVAEVIEMEFGVKYHPGHVRKLLQDFGFSVQTPTRLLASADREKKEKWVQATYPSLKKRLVKEDAE